MVESYDALNRVWDAPNREIIAEQMIVPGKVMMISFRPKKNLVDPVSGSSLLVGLWTTALARLKLLEMLHASATFKKF